MLFRSTHSKPRLHNAMWPGIVGKGPDSTEPFIDLDTMLDLTAQAEVDGQKFDGVDLFMSAPHTSIDSTDDDLKVLANKLQSSYSIIKTPCSLLIMSCKMYVDEHELNNYLSSSIY